MATESIFTLKQAAHVVSNVRFYIIKNVVTAIELSYIDEDGNESNTNTEIYASIEFNTSPANCISHNLLIYYTNLDLRNPIIRVNNQGNIYEIQGRTFFTPLDIGCSSNETFNQEIYLFQGAGGSDGDYVYTTRVENPIELTNKNGEET